MPPSAKSKSFVYEPTQPTNVVDNSNYLTQQTSLFTDQSLTPYDTNIRMGGGFGGQFHDIGHQQYYDNIAMNYGAEIAITPTTISPAIAPTQPTSQINTQNALSETRALTAAIMAYSSSLGEAEGESAYLDGCPDSYAKPTCKGAPVWNNVKSFDNWCASMCPTGLCPAGVCTCSCPRPATPSIHHRRPQVPRCRGIPGWSDPTVDKWCERNCNLDGCTSDFCTCE